MPNKSKKENIMSDKSNGNDKTIEKIKKEEPVDKKLQSMKEIPKMEVITSLSIYSRK